jgi:hypothetical protein
MRAILAVGLAAAALGLAATPAFAFGHHKADCAPGDCCPPQMTVTFVEQTVTDYKLEWKTRDVEVINEVTDYKEVTKTFTRIEQELAFVDRKDIRPSLKLVPKLGVKELTTYKMVPTTCVDPCTGCSKTTFHPEACTEKVPATRYELAHVPEQIVVTTAYLRPVERTYEYTESVPEVKKVKLVRQELYCEKVPYQRIVRVPVYTPCCGAPPETIPAPEQLPNPEPEQPEERK